MEKLGEEPKTLIVSEIEPNDHSVQTSDTPSISTHAQSSGEKYSSDSALQDNQPNDYTDDASMDNTSTNSVNPVNDGSPFGKFKSAEDLYSAYNSLQVEFTKKCQKLSEVSKQLVSMSDDEQSHIDSVATQSQVAQSPQGDATVTPREYERDDWAGRVSLFVSEHPEAREYATEIGSLLISDKTMNLQSAFDKVLAGKFQENKTLIADDEWVKNYVLQNEKVRNMVLKESLNNQRTNVPPTLMSKQSGGFSLSNNYVPASIKEAGDLVLQTLQE